MLSRKEGGYANRLGKLETIMGNVIGIERHQDEENEEEALGI